MSEQHQTQKSNLLNANLVALILIINFIVISGVIFANFSPQVNGNEPVEVALVTTAMPQPSNTPQPPTSIPTGTPTPSAIPTGTPAPSATPTELPAASDTPQAVADADQAASADPVDSGSDPALVEQGEQLFAQCAACHGPDARGLPNLGKDLIASEFVAGLTDDALLDFIKIGRPLWDPLNTTGIDMPGKGGNPALTDDDILAIIAYVRSLSVGG
jgi:disulfide bond formation protein DsbB